MSELKLCPFCGGKAVVESEEPCNDYPGNFYYSWCAYVYCGDCGARGSQTDKQFKTKKEAEAAEICLWNTRA